MITPMNDYWSVMPEAILGGVIVPLRRRSFAGGRHAVPELFPHQPGQGMGDVGRRPLELELEVGLFRDVDEEHYPNRLHDLLVILNGDDQSEPIEYLDPFVDPMHVKVVSWTVAEEAEARNGAVVTIRMEEVTLRAEASSLSVIPRQSPRSMTFRASEVLDAELDLAGITDADIEDAWADAGYPKTADEKASWPAGAAFASASTDFFAELDRGVRAADEVGGLVTGVLARVTSITRLPTVRAPAAFSAYEASLRLLDATASAAEEAIAAVVPVVSWTVPDTMSAIDVSFALYGVRDRDEEILRRNPTRRPWGYERGTTLRVAIQ